MSKYQSLREALLSRASDLVLEWFPRAEVRGSWIYLGNLSGDPGESLKIDLKTGRWKDWESGQSGSDLISLFMERNGLSYGDAAACLSERTGIPLGASRRQSGGSDQAVLPVPENAPAPPISPGSRVPFVKGVLTESYLYRAADGARLFYIVRFEEAGLGRKPKKSMRPLAYFERGGWQWKGVETNSTPLFGLDELARRPDAPVLIVEGEKAALAAASLFPDYVCITWVGGAKRLQKADLSPLKGRMITYWPDADKAGAETVEVMIDRLASTGATELRVVSPPANLPQGWDVADDPPEGIDVHRLLATAEPVDVDASRMFHELDFEQLVQRLVYNSGTEQFIDRIIGLRRTEKQINALFAHRRGQPMAKRLLEDGRLSRVIEFTFRPGKPVLTADGELLKFNLWRPSELAPRSGDATPFFEHVKILTTSEEEAEVVLNFAAHLLQQPSRKLMWALVLVGGQGTGKSLFGEILRDLVGRHNTTMVTTIEIRSDFNDWIEAKLLIVVEEMMALGRREIMNNLKPLITQPMVSINRKHVKRFDIENGANFLMLTNHEDALALEDDDRRFYVVMSDRPANDAAYFETFGKWADENRDVILHALLERDLSAFNPNAQPPMTAGKQRMKDASRPPIDAAVAEAVAEREPPFEHDLVVLAELMAALKQYGSPTAGIDFNRSRLEIALKRAGGRKLGQKSLKERGLQTKLSLWALRDADRYAAMESSQLVRAYFAMRTSRPVREDEIPF